MATKKAADTPEATTSAKSPEMPAYIVRFPTYQLNGRNRIVEFFNGHGVLDRKALAIHNRDMVNPETLVCSEGIGPEFFDDAAKYFSDRGAKIEKVSEKQAEDYRNKLQTDPTGHIPKVEAPKTEKPKAETKGKGGPAGAPPPHKQTRKD